MNNFVGNGNVFLRIIWPVASHFSVITVKGEGNPLFVTVYSMMESLSFIS